MSFSIWSFNTSILLLTFTSSRLFLSSSLIKVVFLNLSFFNSVLTLSTLFVSSLISFSIEAISESITLMFFLSSTILSFNIKMLLSNSWSSTSYFLLSLMTCFFVSRFERVSFILISSSVKEDISSSILIELNFKLSILVVSLVCLLSIVRISSFKDVSLSLSLLYWSFIVLISLAIKEISIPSSSLFKSRYFLASSACFLKGSTFPSSSFITNVTLSRLSIVLTNFLLVSSFLFLYFKILV